MQIIDPKVVDHAHLPAHAPRDYARKRLIEDFPSLHSHKKEDLDKLDQWRIRVGSGPLAHSVFPRNDFSQWVGKGLQLKGIDFRSRLKLPPVSRGMNAAQREGSWGWRESFLCVKILENSSCPTVNATGTRSLGTL